MINFYEIICKIDSFLNALNKIKVCSQFTIDRFGNIKIVIHEIFNNEIDSDYFKICEIFYINSSWNGNMIHNGYGNEIVDAIYYLIDRMNNSTVNQDHFYRRNDFNFE